jgi:hypothetical protein
MKSETLVYDRQLEKCVPASQYYAKQAKGVKRSSLTFASSDAGHHAFQECRSRRQRDIISFSEKREMMKEHGLIEVGNEAPRPTKRIIKPRTSVKQSLKRTLQTLGA